MNGLAAEFWHHFQRTKFYNFVAMMEKREEIKKLMNDFGKQGRPFVFLIDFEIKKPLVLSLEEAIKILHFQIAGYSNIKAQVKKTPLKKWQIKPITFETYRNGFNKIKHHINNGDTYLLNYTQRTQIETNLSLEDIFYQSSAKYKILFKDEFVCFSPETFIKIKDGKIFSYPMKGTIDANIPDSKQRILEDKKETAEHNTIVDLIRNDLSLISENVTVDKFRFLDLVKTNYKNLWQVSSQISGTLPENYCEKMGDIIFSMLPAGSVSGAPKKKTIEIILDAEKYERGYYTGVFGYFDGKNLDSCVLIRYIENQNGQLVYKSGGGITFMSEAQSEYEELLKKVYVPIV